MKRRAPSTQQTVASPGATTHPLSPAGLSDRDLLDALRRHEPAAWALFDARFRPLLEAHARKSNIPRWEWNAVIVELLADEALRLSNRKGEPPRRLDGYLRRAMRNKFLQIKRGDMCRLRHYVAASDARFGEWIVPSTCSEAARRASAGPDAPSHATSHALTRLARDLRTGMTDEEQTLLEWVSEGVPRTVMAQWLGVGHNTCAKRVWRLCHRLRATAAERSKTYDADARREIDRFVRRAGKGGAVSAGVGRHGNHPSL